MSLASDATTQEPRDACEDELSHQAKHVTIEDADEHQVEETVKEMNAPDDRDPDAAGEGEPATNELPFMIEEKKKKRKKKKSKLGKKGEAGPSGFEDSFAEAPLTVEQHQVEQELYSPSKSLSSRVETAAQHFVSRRKFDGERNQVWTLYMQFGGIKSGNKMFGGVGKELNALDKDDDPSGDAQTLKAKEFVGNDIYEDQLKAIKAQEESIYIVDFNGVVKAFFSLYLPSAMSMQNEEKIKTYTSTVRSWLNYLLHHSVCDEYRRDILDARSTCDLADRELWALQNIRNMFPGDFSEACRAIYNKPRNYELPDEASWTWADTWAKPVNMDRDKAERVFLTALAGLGDDAMIDRYRKENEVGIQVTRTFETSLEVHGIEKPTAQIRYLYADDSSHGLIAMGKVFARTWYMDWEPEQDLTEEEEAALPAKREAERREYEFWVDEETLQHIFVGFKFTASIKELSFGVFYLDNIMQTYTSFVTWLPNELMSGWREHEWIEPDREKMLERIEQLDKEQGGDEGGGNDAGDD